jgi:hypothetical protein
MQDENRCGQVKKENHPNSPGWTNMRALAEYIANRLVKKVQERGKI